MTKPASDYDTQDGDRRFEEYLGDGAYCYFDRFDAIVLYTSNGIRETNRVVLEREVYEKFGAWCRKISGGIE